MLTDKKIINYSQLKRLRNKNKDKKIVLTAGCYDLLHLGHLIHLSYCKSKGDILVVSIGNDITIRTLKGNSRPINSEVIRARMLAAMSVVDYVVISEEYGKMDHSRSVSSLKPDLYIAPSSDTHVKEKRELVESNGGVFMLCKRIPPNHIKGGISTTALEGKLVGT